MTFPPSPFAVPTSSFPFPVPPPADQVGGCDNLAIVFPSKWLPYILGSLTQLTLQATWLGTPEEIQNAQGEAWQLISTIQQSACPPEQFSSGQECGDDDMSCCFRIENNMLQCFSCGQWNDFLDLSTIGAGQPGPQPESPQPGGGTASTCFNIGAVGTAFLPWKVSSGDVLLVSNPTGAVNRPGTVNWRGPSGLSFLLNNYVPYSQVLDGSNTLATSPDLGLIVTFDGGSTWHDLWNNPGLPTAQPYTVPGGVVDVQPVIAVNQHPGDIVGGSYGFCVQVTNNGISAWVVCDDFSLSTWSWAPNAAGRALWVSGSGWHDQAFAISTDNYQAAWIDLIIPATDFDVIDVEFTYVQGSFSVVAAAYDLLLNGSVVDSIASNAISNGHQHRVYSTPAGGITDVRVVINSAYGNPSPPGTPGSVVINSIKLSGHGSPVPPGTPC